MRRRRDEADTRRRVADLRNPRIDLVARQLSAFTRLGALRHLDLQILGVDEVLAGDAEARRRDLLDGAAPPVAVGVALLARRTLAAFAGVRLPSFPVYGDRRHLLAFPAHRSSA